MTMPTPFKARANTHPRMYHSGDTATDLGSCTRCQPSHQLIRAAMSCITIPQDLYFEVNNSRFLYGEAINAIIVFLLVLGGHRVFACCSRSPAVCNLT